MSHQKNILILNPYSTASHESWVSGIKEHSKFNVLSLSMPGRHWKWRMHGAALYLAQESLKISEKISLILVTDMMDLALFKALTVERFAKVPMIVYFHENQLSYPWSPKDKDPEKGRDLHYGFINFSSMACADKVIFNSDYHRDIFIKSLRKLLDSLPDYQEKSYADKIIKKSLVLPVGLNKKNDANKADKVGKPLCIIWNHRWEYDKNPSDFFEALFRLKKEGIAFELIALGGKEENNKVEIFKEAKKTLQKEIIKWGWVETKEDYYNFLNYADIIPITSYHEFFGISLLEGILYDCFPLMPKRLVYPEHFDVEQFEECFYETNEDFYLKLKKMLLEKEVKKSKKMQGLTECYYWENCITQYDQLFASFT